MPRPAVLALLALLAGAPAAADELWERPWIEVRTPHFTLLSALGEERSVALARDLESFRRSAERVTNIGRFEERIPTYVYVLPHRVGELGLTRDTAGYLVAEMRANHALIARVGRVDVPEMLRHEYVH